MYRSVVLKAFLADQYRGQSPALELQKCQDHQGHTGVERLHFIFRVALFITQHYDSQ